MSASLVSGEFVSEEICKDYAHAGDLSHCFVHFVHENHRSSHRNAGCTLAYMRSVSRPGGKRRRSLASQLFVMQVVVVAAVVAGGAVLAYLNAARSTTESARRHVTAVAAAIADAPVVAGAVTDANPSQVLQPYAEQV